MHHVCIHASVQHPPLWIVLIRLIQMNGIHNVVTLASTLPNSSCRCIPILFDCFTLRPPHSLLVSAAQGQPRAIQRVEWTAPRPCWSCRRTSGTSWQSIRLSGTLCRLGQLRRLPGLQQVGLDSTHASELPSNQQAWQSTYLADFPCAITHNADASCRFWGWWADGVLKELQGISVAVPAGRFLQQHADQSGGTRLLFQLSDQPSQWLQLLGRFLTMAAPPGVPLASFLRQPAAAAAAAADGGAVAYAAAAQPGLWVTCLRASGTAPHSPRPTRRSAAFALGTCHRCPTRALASASACSSAVQARPARITSSCRPPSWRCRAAGQAARPEQTCIWSRSGRCCGKPQALTTPDMKHLVSRKGPNMKAGAHTASLPHTL